VNIFLPLEYTVYCLCQCITDCLEWQSVSKNRKMEGKLVRFWKRTQIVGARLAGESVTKTAISLDVSCAIMGENQHRQLTERDRSSIRKIVSKIHRATAARVTGQQNWISILKTLFTQKTGQRKLHEYNIHGRAATAKITDSNAQVHKRWCHDHKTWTIRQLKRVSDMVRWVVLHMLFPTPGRVYSWRTPKETYNLECLVPRVKQGGSSVMVWAVISW
jgi:hypothetical protein